MIKSLNDNDLILEIKDGNPRAYKLFVERYQNPIANICIGLLGDVPEAEEIAQEVFIKFYFKINDFRQDSTIKTYLTRIAINLSLNELKKRQRNNARYISEGDNIQIIAVESEEKNIELKELVKKALQMIEPDLRTVVILRLMEGYSTKETAKIMKIPQGTVLSRLFRAQEKLKLILKNYL
ncbi:MAG: sigma-70 family RNA polymerase sigma factor [Bacteroidales bacterium]|nr:sigma-70 family RNA polymerase sigma factor [Bacteroidales bacterium]